jgi:exodeoxyribonuclease V gamma subunit
MNDDAFPRTRVPLGFDYVAKNPRPGDRTSRDDDRYLFLEALVSARDQLIVTYVGRSLRDGSLRAPSVVVEELIDEVLRLAGASDREASRARLVVEHPLHAFSPRYFDGSAATLFSYSKADCAGAEALVAAREERGGGACGRAWVPAPVSLREDGANAVELTDLARFFEHPTRAFLQRRFGLYLRDEVESLEDREPLELDSLDRWVHSDALLRGQLAGLTPGAAAAHVRADGGLPPGVIGDVAESVSLGRVERLLQQVEGARAGGALAPVEVDRSLGRWHLYGLLGDLWPGGRVVYQLSLLPHPREINFWIQHLVLNWLAPEGIPRKSFLVARKGEDAEVRVLPPCDDPEPMLLELLELYAQGQTLPLPLLRVTSLRQAIDGEKWGYRDEASKSASASWTGYAGGPPAGRDDPYLAQAFRDVDPLDPRAPIPGPRFADLARRVYEPYLREVEDLK